MPLKINTNTIHKISGPVSMHILYPTDKIFKEFKYSPILILFGDVHKGAEGFCKNEDGKEDKKHYNVFDVEFLQLLSNEVEGKGLIDFYVEGGDFHIVNPIGNLEYPMGKLLVLFRDCYKNIRMIRKPSADNEQKCNMIKNIRWQSGDIRSFRKNQSKNYLYNKFRDMQLISKTKPEIISIIREKIVELQEYIKRDIPVMCEEVTKEDLVKEFTTNKDNLIYKQLYKMDYAHRPYFIGKIKNYLNSIYEYYQLNDNMKKILSLNNDFKRILTIDIHSEEANEILEILYLHYLLDKFQSYTDFLLLRDTLKPDLYILGRIYKIISLKQYKDEIYSVDRPLINIIYFGDAHIDHLLTILTQDGEYESESYKNPFTEESQNRCIDLSGENIINLNDKINSLITKHQQGFDVIKSNLFNFAY